MFHKVAVANRGAVAARIIRSLRELGVRSVAIHSEADAGAPYLAAADEVYAIAGSAARETYLNQDILLGIVRRSGADGLHPGYGFLSENAPFATRVIEMGAGFIGPSPKWIEAMGSKTEARALMGRHGMPVAPGSGALGRDTDALAEARAIGFPVLVKPSGGGGGIGMIAVHEPGELNAAVDRARSMAERSFGVADIYLEKLIERPRHIEFQIVADRQGNVRHVFERDCSVQRRHQKVIEEAPAPGLARATVDALAERTAAILRELAYDNIGTVETLMGEDGTFSFLEMNTRLQVEHAVTEEVTGVDLVQAQIRSAAGESVSALVPADIAPTGHAIEARVCAEDPRTFYPSPGTLARFRPPSGEGVRVETGYCEGRVVSSFYDSLVAKVVCRGADRTQAIGRLRDALQAFEIEGVKTNIPFIVRTLDAASFQEGRLHTGLAAEVAR